jgi:hypothetical protein
MAIVLELIGDLTDRPIISNAWGQPMTAIVTMFVQPRKGHLPQLQALSK